MRLICIGDEMHEICSMGRHSVLSWAYLAAPPLGSTHYYQLLQVQARRLSLSTFIVKAPFMLGSSNRGTASLSLSKCNPNGDLALCGEKNYDFKRPSSVQIFVPVGCGWKRNCLARIKKKVGKISENLSRSLTAFSADDINRSWADPKPGHQGRAIPEIIKFLSLPAFDISWPPISSYWT